MDITNLSMLILRGLWKQWMVLGDGYGLAWFCCFVFKLGPVWLPVCGHLNSVQAMEAHFGHLVVPK